MSPRERAEFAVCWLILAMGMGLAAVFALAAVAGLVSVTAQSVLLAVR